MSASTSVITDTQTCITNAPNATSAQSKSNQAAGVIMDLAGNFTAVLTKFQEAKVLLNAINQNLSAAGGADTTIFNTVANILLTLS